MVGNSGGKPVSYPSYRMKVFWATAIFLKMPSESQDKIINGTGGRKYLVAPYIIATN